MIWPSTLLQKVVGLIVTCLEFFIPLIILVYCYGRIIWVLSRRMDSDLNTSNLQAQTFELARTNTIKTMFTVALCFVICLSNSQIYYLMSNLGFQADWNSPFYKFTVVMTFLNCTINPFIYLTRYTDFQKALMKSFGCVKSRESQNSHTKTSTLSTSM